MNPARTTLILLTLFYHAVHSQNSRDYFFPLDSLHEQKTYVYFDITGESKRDLQYSFRFEDGMLYNVVYDDWDTSNVVVESINKRGSKLEFINIYLYDTLGNLIEKEKLKFNCGGFKFVDLSKIHRMNYRQKLRYDNVTYKTKQKFHYKRDDDLIVCHKSVTVVYRTGLFRREKERKEIILGYGKGWGLVRFHVKGSDNHWVLKEVL